MEWSSKPVQMEPAISREARRQRNIRPSVAAEKKLKKGLYQRAFANKRRELPDCCIMVLRMYERRV